jgi:hypothetical protein
LEGFGFALFAIAIHHRVLPGEGGRWLRESLLAPLAGLALPFAVGGIWLSDAPYTLMSFAQAVLVGAFGVCGAFIATPAGRRQIAHLLRSSGIFPRGRG